MLIVSSNKNTGDNMSITVRSSSFPTDGWRLRAHDLFIVSVFGMWSAILGLSPVLAFYALVSN
jgi:hypothetical protein